MRPGGAARCSRSTVTVEVCLVVTLPSHAAAPTRLFLSLARTPRESQRDSARVTRDRRVFSCLSVESVSLKDGMIRGEIHNYTNNSLTLPRLPTLCIFYLVKFITLLVFVLLRFCIRHSRRYSRCSGASLPEHRRKSLSLPTWGGGGGGAAIYVDA